MHPEKPKHAPRDKLAWRIDEFGDLSGLGRTKIYELIKNGALRTVKVGGRRLVPRDDGLALLDKGAA